MIKVSKQLLFIYPVLCSVLYICLQLFINTTEPYFFLNLLFILIFVYGITYIAKIFSLSMPISHEEHFKLTLLAIVIFSVMNLVGISFILALAFITVSVVFSFMTISFQSSLLNNAYAPLSPKLIMAQLYDARSLMEIWFTNSINARYVQTILGILWIALLPLAQSLVMSFALTRLLKVQSIGIPWVVFLLSGRIIFGIFQSVVLQSSASLITNNELIKRVYFPREIIIILIVAEVLIDFSLQFVALLIIGWLFNLPPNIYYILLPIPVLIMTLFSTGIGLIVSWLSLIIRDFRPLLTILLQLVMYLTIFYAKRATGENLEVMLVINPLLAITEAFRDIILYAQVPNFSHLLVAFFISLAILYPGYVLFKVNEDRFADYS